MCIRQALGFIESAIRLELTEVDTCTLEELSERLSYYFMEPGVFRGGPAQPTRYCPPPAGGLGRPQPCRSHHVDPRSTLRDSGLNPKRADDTRVSSCKQAVDKQLF